MKDKSTLGPGLCGDNLLDCVLRGVFLANPLATTDQYNEYTENNCKIQHNKTSVIKTILYKNTKEKPRITQDRQ